MIELTQTIVDGVYGNCYGTALACILGFNPKHIPELPRDDAEIEANHKKHHSGMPNIPCCHYSIADKRSEYWHDMWRLFKAVNNIRTAIFPMDKFGQYSRYQYKDVWHVLSGISPRDRDLQGNEGRGRRHAVVGKGGLIYWDPHPSRAGLLSVDDIEFIFPADPSKPMCQGLERA